MLLGSSSPSHDHEEVFWCPDMLGAAGLLCQLDLSSDLLHRGVGAASSRGSQSNLDTSRTSSREGSPIVRGSSKRMASSQPPPRLPCSDTMSDVSHPNGRLQPSQLPPLQPIDGLLPPAATSDNFLLQDIWPVAYTGEGAGLGLGEDGGTVGSCNAYAPAAATRQPQALLLQTALLELDTTRAGLTRANAESDRLRDLLHAVARERDAARQQCRQALLLLQMHLSGQLVQQQQQQTPPTTQQPVLPDSSLAAMVPQPAPFLLNDNSSVGTGSSSQGQQLVLHQATSAAPPPSVSSSEESSIVSSPPPPQQQHGGDAFASPPQQQRHPAAEKRRDDGSPSTERPLPERGRLLEAVLNAGPLLQDLLLMGPLPQWHNPPPPPTHGLDVVVPPATFATGSVSSGGMEHVQAQGLGKRKEREEDGGELLIGYDE